MTPRVYDSRYTRDKYYGILERSTKRQAYRYANPMRHENFKQNKGRKIKRSDYDFKIDKCISRYKHCESENMKDRKAHGCHAYEDNRPHRNRTSKVSYVDRKEIHNKPTKHKPFVKQVITADATDLPNINLDSGFSCVTHEYYLLDINKRFPFSLTVNELLTIDRSKVTDLIDSINTLLEEHEYKTLETYALIDYTLYINDFLCIAIPKATILTNNKDGKGIYAVEIIVNSLHPAEYEDVKEILPHISNIIYNTILEMGLETNGRLIPDGKEPPIKDFVIYKIVKESGDFRNLQMNIKNNKLSELQKIYYPYLDIDLLFNEYSISDDKLLILHGENGSGKTKLSTMLLHMFSSKNYSCLSIPGTIVDDITLWSHIDFVISDRDNAKEGMVFIIDDIDPIYLNRDTKDGHTENKFFNNLLIMLDGNVDVPIKVIITSNYHIREELDEPLYRTGRLFDILNIRYLTKQEASKVLEFNNRDKKSIKEFFTAHKDINGLYKQSDIAQYIKEKERNITRKYVKENEISGGVVRIKSKIGF